MSNPPEGVKIVLEAVCVMLAVDPKKKIDKGTGEVTLNYWKPSQKIMGKSKFLQPRVGNFVTMVRNCRSYAAVLLPN